MKFKDSSDKWTSRVFFILIVLAVIAFKIALLYQECDDNCAKSDGKMKELRFLSLAATQCVCYQK